MAFVVHLLGEGKPPIEYEADSLEEKNKIFRLLSGVIAHHHEKPDVVIPEDVVDAKPLREGRVEKKGHSVAYFNWQRLVCSFLD